ncbi:SMCs flexible hinge [Lactarius psammicola]|nr:SMCs flexible hinge [Lactarius psammicola]
MAAYEKQEVGLEEKRKHADSKAEKLKKSLQDDENARDAALRSIQENSAKAESEKRKADQYEEELQQEEKVLEGIRDRLKDKTLVFRDWIEQKQTELQPWKTKINQKQAEVDVKTSERDMLVKRAEAVEQDNAQAREALETVKGDQKAKDLTIRVNQLRAQASSTRQRVEEAKASQAANTSQNKVLDSLTHLRNSGRVSGFHGRLRSLGTIPDKYDVAITTACGSLNNMVVDTVQQGQACIEYLRKQNVGRANFLVLEKVDETNGMRSMQTPENVPRLFDLVKPKEPRFAHAFYKALRDTLVAQDLAQANRIAFGTRRWRVVTLAGELIDSSGTMSGGGAKPSGGGLSSKLAADAVSPDVLRKYEHDSEAAAAQLTEAMEELRAAEAELEAVGKSGPQIDLNIDKVNLDIQNGWEARRRSGKAGPRPQSELERLRSQSSTIEEAIKALEKKILDIGGSRLLAQKSKVDGFEAPRQTSQTKRSPKRSNRKSLKEVEIEFEKLSELLQEVKDYVANNARARVEAT